MMNTISFHFMYLFSLIHLLSFHIFVFLSYMYVDIYCFFLMYLCCFLSYTYVDICCSFLYIAVSLHIFILSFVDSLKKKFETRCYCHIFFLIQIKYFSLSIHLFHWFISKIIFLKNKKFSFIDFLNPFPILFSQNLTQIVDFSKKTNNLLLRTIDSNL
jgi:hypothetical protein